MHIHLAHMAAGRQERTRSIPAMLVRFILFLPLAALWVVFGLPMLAAIVFGWYAAGTMLLSLF